MSKVDKWLKDKNLQKITEWARDSGKTISDIASLMGISSSTFYEWKSKYPEIDEAFENGRKIVPDCVKPNDSEIPVKQYRIATLRNRILFP